MSVHLRLLSAAASKKLPSAVRIFARLFVFQRWLWLRSAANHSIRGQTPASRTFGERMGCTFPGGSAWYLSYTKSEARLQGGAIFLGGRAAARFLIGVDLA